LPTASQWWPGAWIASPLTRDTLLVALRLPWFLLALPALALMIPFRLAVIGGGLLTVAVWHPIQRGFTAH